MDHGTVNFIALDSHGNLASAVSTSGLAWKYPGRVGDSPVVKRATTATIAMAGRPAPAWANWRSASSGA
ncbi:MAG: isoaspartyl peptidase/L-asparaginase [Caldilineaceae bacterium]